MNEFTGTMGGGRVRASGGVVYRPAMQFDLGLSADGIPYYIEANPNPEIAKAEEFASAAKHDGIEYPELIQRIVTLGISRAGATL